MRTRGGRSPLPPLARDGYVALAAVFLALRLLQVRPWDQSVDAYAYWSTAHGPMYGQTAGAMGAYVYSPAFAQLLTPITILPWAWFVTIWTGLNFAALWWLLGRWSLPSMLFLPIPFEIISGNVHLFYAAALVLGFRTAAPWALMLLTKLTPGVGVLWFAVRREWRPLSVAVGVTAVLVVASYLVDPGAWRGWLDILQKSSSTPATLGWFLPVPLLVRLPIAAVLTVGAAWTNRRWLLPLALVAAMPVVWLNSLAVLAACVPLAGASGSMASRFGIGSRPSRAASVAPTLAQATE